MSSSTRKGLSVLTERRAKDVYLCTTQGQSASPQTTHRYSLCTTQVYTVYPPTSQMSLYKSPLSAQPTTTQVCLYREENLPWAQKPAQHVCLYVMSAVSPQTTEHVRLYTSCLSAMISETNKACMCLHIRSVYNMLRNQQEYLSMHIRSVCSDLRNY